eukprot:CAMPEP_0184032286 /NCGR_PEP_ID=MMETSP0955-20130417/2911_1 /TAXON_ID=627963 /ORGANISM="Aplanochytrium sp, Strain PBS07" /LENGTH=70 /DNA_ID=CAMNT_0026318299 /DNA_START=936 /DNA_END=1148 /DNA_ORIENTATION=-
MLGGSADDFDEEEDPLCAFAFTVLFDDFCFFIRVDWVSFPDLAAEFSASTLVLAVAVSSTCARFEFVVDP